MCLDIGKPHTNSTRILSKPCTCQKAPVGPIGKCGLGQQISGQFARVTPSAIFMSTGRLPVCFFLAQHRPCQIGIGRWVSNKNWLPKIRVGLLNWLECMILSKPEACLGRRSTTVKGFSGSLWRVPLWTHRSCSLWYYMAVCQNLVPLVNIKIVGKWMFIPLKMVLIGIDPYPYQRNFWGWQFYKKTPESHALSAIPYEQGHKLEAHSHLQTNPYTHLNLYTLFIVLKLDMYTVYIYIYIHTYIYIYTCVYIPITLQFMSHCIALHSIPLHDIHTQTYKCNFICIYDSMILWFWKLKIWYDVMVFSLLLFFLFVSW